MNNSEFLKEHISSIYPQSDSKLSGEIIGIQIGEFGRVSLFESQMALTFRYNTKLLLPLSYFIEYFKDRLSYDGVLTYYYDDRITIYNNRNLYKKLNAVERFDHAMERFSDFEKLLKAVTDLNGFIVSDNRITGTK